MVWKRTEEESYVEYGNFLGEILACLGFGNSLKAYLVHKNKTLLTVNLTELRDDDQTRKLPLGVSGTTDVLIGPIQDSPDAGSISVATSETTVSNKKRKRMPKAPQASTKPPASESVAEGAGWTTAMPDLANIRVVFQLKKSLAAENARISRYNHCMCQATAELFTADLRANGPVVSVLTDLEDDWTFQWLATGDKKAPRLRRCRVQSKREGLTALASVLKASQKELSETFKCVKVEGLAVADTDGVGPEQATLAEDEENEGDVHMTKFDA